MKYKNDIFARFGDSHFDTSIEYAWVCACEKGLLYAFKTQETVFTSLGQAFWKQYEQ